MSIAGHPIHPMLVPLPIGAAIFALISTLVFFFGGDPMWFSGGYWLSLAVVVFGLMAAVFGLADWSQISAESRYKGVGLMHMVLNVVVVTLFLVSWLAMGGTSGPLFGNGVNLPLLMQVLAVATLGVSGWLGGEMVYGSDEAEQKQADPAADRRRQTAH